MLLIYNARKRIKPNWHQVLNLALIEVYGEENLADNVYKDFIVENKYQNILAKRKLFNPLKLPEFLLCLLAKLVDRVCQIGMQGIPLNADAATIAPLTDDALLDNSRSRFFLRLAANFFLGGLLALIRHVTSPITTIYRPLVQYEIKHPNVFRLLVFLGAACVSLLVAAAVMYGGVFFLSFPLLAGLAKLATTIASAVYSIASYIPFVTMAHAMLCTQIGFISSAYLATSFCLNLFLTKLAIFSNDIDRMGFVKEAIIDSIRFKDDEGSALFNAKGYPGVLKKHADPVEYSYYREDHPHVKRNPGHFEKFVTTTTAVQEDFDKLLIGMIAPADIQNKQAAQTATVYLFNSPYIITSLLSPSINKTKNQATKIDSKSVQAELNHQAAKIKAANKTGCSAMRTEEQGIKYIFKTFFGGYSSNGKQYYLRVLTSNPNGFAGQERPRMSLQKTIPFNCYGGHEPSVLTRMIKYVTPKLHF